MYIYVYVNIETDFIFFLFTSLVLWASLVFPVLLVSANLDQPTLTKTFEGLIVFCVLETFTNNCPGWDECENNPVRSFWKKASAEVSYRGGIKTKIPGGGVWLDAHVDHEEFDRAG